MTVEELKATAKAMGYNIIPIRKYIKLLPCRCGCNRREHWVGTDGEHGEWGEILKCPKCGFNVWGKNEREVVKNWNSAVMRGGDE